MLLIFFVTAILILARLDNLVFHFRKADKFLAHRPDVFAIPYGIIDVIFT